MTDLTSVIDARNRGTADLVFPATGIVGPQGPAGPAGEFAVNIDGGMSNTVYGGIDPIIAGGAE
jgi:hypothetical protein